MSSEADASSTVEWAAMLVNSDHSSPRRLSRKFRVCGYRWGYRIGLGVEAMELENVGDLGVLCWRV
jgi:hypothetical protein